MRHSLQLKALQVVKLYETVKKELEDKTPLKGAYVASVDELRVPTDKLNLSMIDEHIEFIASRCSEPNHVRLLFDILSHLVKNEILSNEKLNSVVDPIINDKAKAHFGSLVITKNGSWDIRWKVGPPNSITNLDVPKYDPEVGEVVPEPIVEILQSVVLCLQSDSNLSALSLSLVALETTLWDHLSTKGISKTQQIDKYPYSVNATLKWDGTQYTLELFDHEKRPKVPTSEGEINFEIYRTSKVKGGTHRVLKALVEDVYADWLSCDDGKETEEKDISGLSVALQRARKEGLITYWDKDLDVPFRVLRNNLVHQKSDYKDTELHTPYGDVRLDEIAKRQDLALFFIKRIVEYIYEAYYDFQIVNSNS